jgi:histidyl-tRNA synthetase
MAQFEKISAPRGMPDALPGDMPLIRLIEQTAHRVFQLYGYEEIRTPLFEETRLFVRGIGEATDIVEKEMYTFAEGDGSLTLRPEATAPVVRSVVEHDLLKQKGFWKLYYVGPMFRKERPQAGRLRQFTQVGCEAVGSLDPTVDAESILLADRFFREIGLEGVVPKLNSIGCPNCRARYRNVLLELFAPKRPELCQDCQGRLERNVFRVLDCKNPHCKEIAREAPPMREHLDADCGAHFDAVLQLLAEAGLRFEIDDHLVRGFDYYTRTVFELVHSSLGARSTVCGGGRYDNLVAELGGPAAGCVGFAVGVVPTILALRKANAAPEYAGPGLDLYIVAVDAEVRKDCFRIAQRFRSAGVKADLDAEGRSLKAQMRSADKLNARHVLVVGPDELRAGRFKLKTMATGEEFVSSLEELIGRLGGTEE